MIGKNLSAKLWEHFFKTREAFRRQIDEIPIASKAVRLWTLDRMARRAEELENLTVAADMLEHAAKEMGGVYSGRDAGLPDARGAQPTEPQHPGADHLAELSARYSKGLAIIQGGKEE